MRNVRNQKFYKGIETLVSPFQVFDETNGGKAPMTALLGKDQEMQGYIKDQISQVIESRFSKNTEQQEVQCKKNEADEVMQKTNKELVRKGDQGEKYADLNYLKISTGLHLHEGLKIVWLDGLTTAEGLKLHEGLKILYLNGIKTTEGLHLPEGLKKVSLNALRTIEGLKLPEGLNNISLARIKIDKKEQLRKKYPHVKIV